MKKKLLNKLVDKYESSKSFIGQNKVNQVFSVIPAKLFPKYSDDAEVGFFTNLNKELSELESTSFISVSWSSGNIAELATLNVDFLDAVYNYLGRQPRKQTQFWIEKTLNEFSKNASPLLLEYIKTQKIRINNNKNVEFFNSNEKDFEDLLHAVDFIQKNSDEILIRNASLILFKDSKRLESIESSVQSLMRKYGDYEGCDDVFAECNVVKTPTQVLMKGNACIHLESQILDLSQITGDVGLSTKSLKDVASIDVFGSRIVTIENLTSFYTYENSDDFVIYLGGFHNSAKREFIKKVYDCNSSKIYRHFGDIDAGGFYILKHLRNKTGIHFIPMCMNVETLKRYKDVVKSLTAEDRKRLEYFLNDEDFNTVATYMLENNCKLEQENVHHGILF